MEKFLRRCHDKKLLELHSGPRPRDNNSNIRAFQRAFAQIFVASENHATMYQYKSTLTYEKIVDTYELRLEGLLNIWHSGELCNTKSIYVHGNE